MSVVGFDIGNLNSVIAVARNRGIDVICNEVSNRATPSLVSFGPKSRYLGESAKTQEISNFKNTVGSLKRLIGPVSKEQFEVERSFSGANLVHGIDGTVSASVQYMNETQTFNFTQLMAMYLSKLKEITEAELKTGVCDVVISVPVYFSDCNRRALIDAAQIAGLNVLRLMNDVTAAGLQWGITRELTESPKYVAFVDIGNSDLTVQISSFSKGLMQVKSCAYDKNFGGRDFDNALLNHFVEEFKTKYKMNVRENPKALFRLRSACERVKKVLSANAQSPLNIECLMNDKDVSSMVERGQFEEYISPLVAKLEKVLEQALSQTGLTKDDIEAVELIGGTTRIPLVKNKITSFFGKEPSTTLNQDECVAKGCTFMCAILSPVFRTREFKVEDICVDPIKFVYPGAKEGEDIKEIVAFPVSSAIPSTKLLTFKRAETFDMEAFQSGRWIGKYSVKVSSAGIKDSELVVKVKVRVNPDGCLDVGGGHVLVDAPPPASGTEKKPAAEGAEAAANGNTAEPEAAKGGEKRANGTVAAEEEAIAAGADAMDVDAPSVKKVKKEIPVSSANSALQSKPLEDLRSSELKMVAADKLVMETDNARNSLEEYIYDIRGKLESTHAEFSRDEVKEKLLHLCTETEDWLYGDGEDSTKSVYVEKLNGLRKDGDPILTRYNEFELFPPAYNAFQAFLVGLVEQVNGTQHLQEADKLAALKAINDEKTTVHSKVITDESKPKHENKSVTCEDLTKLKSTLEYKVRVILAKAKPPKPEKKEEKKEEATPPPSANAKAAGGSGSDKMEEGEEDCNSNNENAEAGMDVETPEK